MMCVEGDGEERKVEDLVISVSLDPRSSPKLGMRKRMTAGKKMRSSSRNGLALNGRISTHF